MALARLIEGELDRTLAIVPLKAREFAALIVLHRSPFPGEGAQAWARKSDAAQGHQSRAARMREQHAARTLAPHAARAPEPRLAPRQEPPAGRTQRDVARALALSAGATNDLLGRLERRRLVRREGRTTALATEPARAPAGGPARRPGRPQVRFALTPRGEATLARAAAFARKVEDDWARRLEAAGGSSYGLRRWLEDSLAGLRGRP